MYALFVDGTSTQTFAEKPDLHESLDVRDVSDVPGFEVGWVITSDGGYALPPAPTILYPDPPKPITFKADLWRRATDGEAVQMEGALGALPVRLRRMYEDSQHISHDDEFFPVLSEGLIGLFGEPRTSELLAVSV